MYTEQVVCETGKFWIVVMGVLQWLEWMMYCMSVCKRCVEQVSCAGEGDGTKLRKKMDDWGGMWGLYQDDHHVCCVMRCTRQMGH